MARPYSLVNDPLEKHHYEIGVLRVGHGGVSDWLHELEIGQELLIESPRNDFPLARGAAEYVLIGGGIGVTPLLSMATQLSREGCRFTLRVLVRSRDRLPFASRLGALPPGSAHVHVSDEAGRLSVRSSLEAISPEAHVYVCGPRSLLEEVRAEAHARGVPTAHLHEERFDSGAKNEAERAFEVELRASGLRLQVEPGRTILEEAEAAGVFPIYDCRRGTCGTCLTRVISGVPEHRDVVQSAREKATNEFMTICCSRALSASLTLDL